MARIALPFGLVLVVGVSLSFGYPPGYHDLGNVLVGAAIALIATYTVEAWKRSRLAKDLAIALYHELANLAARCCFDFEAPWSIIWERPERVSRFRAGKFAPELPTIFTANADKMALLESNVLSALMAFYFRLSVIRRDIENLRADATDHSDLGADAVHVIASRFAASLAPGLHALVALGAMVPSPASVDADALNTVDPGHDKRAEGTLRERLAKMIQRADEVRARVEGPLR